jgi:hypothetical protein
MHIISYLPYRPSFILSSQLTRVGKEVSLFVKSVFAKELLRSESLRQGDIENALKESFHRIDDMLNDPVSVNRPCLVAIVYR